MLYLDRSQDINIVEMELLFYELQEKFQVTILTTLHPITKHYLFWKYECNVYCRDFCLTIKEMQDTIASKELTDKFYSNMVEFKTRVIKELAEDRIVLYYIDDLIDMFREVPFPPNVILLSPDQLLKMMNKKKD
jgi:hypothetical protein